jgi:cell division protease FtsH
LGGGHDEREQTLNQILVEMDGFEPNNGVVVISATNRPDILDPALLRPGRFDRRVILDLPDVNDREQILKVHGQDKPLESAVDLRQIAERTPGFSGADLANLMNEAAILAARRNKKSIGQLELIDSIEKVLLGPERKSHVLSVKEKEIAAYHEAGHALVAHILPNVDPVRKISIIARGRAAGYTLKLPVEDKHLHSRSEFLEELSVLLAGFTSEKLVFNEITTGAANDLERASELARQIVTQYGMSEKIGPITFGNREEMVFLGKEITTEKDYSEKVATEIDEEVSRLIHDAQQNAAKIITEKRNLLDKIAQKLIENETIEKEEFEELMKETNDKQPSKPPAPKDDEKRKAGAKKQT